MKVPLLDLSREFNHLGTELREAVTDALESFQYIMGPQVSAFESRFAEFIGSPYALGVSSGTDALLLCLMAEDVGQGDEIITTPFTFFATAGCIARLGARPVFVDIDENTFNVSVDQIETKITDRTRALLPVHLFGQMCDMDGLTEIATRNTLFVLEDCAQATGATYRGKQAGSIGDYGAFSFFPSKNLSGIGDGGAITVSDEVRYTKVKSLRTHGSSPSEKYIYDDIGGNFRLDTLQAAALIVKLRHFDTALKKRQEKAIRYRNLIKDLVPKGLAEEHNLIVPQESEPSHHTYNQFMLRSTSREKYLSLAQERGIGSAIYYPVPLHLQPCFSYLGYKEGDFPVSEKVAKEIFSLPIYPDIPEEHQVEVVTCLRDALS